MAPPTQRRAAIVTGAGSGLGRATAVLFARTGVDCVIVGRRSEPLLETQRLANEADAAAEVVTCDVTLAEDRERLVRACLSRFGRLDILVNNAGGGSSHPVPGFPAQAWDADLATNLQAPFFLSQLAIAEMRPRRFGRIVNIASVLGMRAGRLAATTDDGSPAPRGSAYTAAKGGLIALGRDLAVAVAADGITVNTVSPGYIERPERARPAETLAAIRRTTPMGRPGEPDDVAHAVRYLCSEEAGYVTGINLVVDGGLTAC